MWDDRYSAEHYVYGEEPNDFLRENYQRLPKGKILSLAEGEGRNAVFLAAQGYSVTAVDASSVGLKKAEQLAKKRGVSIECIHADLSDFEIAESSWDGIVSIFCHLPPEIRHKLYPSVVAGLKPLGVLLLEAYRPEQLGRGTGGPPDSALMLSKTLLEQELPGLHFLLLHELERDVVEGEFHTGWAAVVQAIAIREDE